MDLTTSTRVAQLTGDIENTPELQTYWEKRYKSALEDGKIVIHTKTLGLLEQQHISRPITPIADIALTKHLLGNNTLDEIELRSTIETIVRLLDSFIEILDLTPQARATVEGYRKVAIGIADFNEYFSLQHNQSRPAIIEYVGQFTANASYRSSESLAEEKGVCMEWDRVQTDLRPKTFEYWYHTETGDIKDGLEISEEFDESTIERSPYLIVPRRNVSLLFFPSEPDWHTWSDRDIQGGQRTARKENFSSQPIPAQAQAPAPQPAPQQQITKPAPAKKQQPVQPNIFNTSNELVAQASDFKLVQTSQPTKNIQPSQASDALLKGQDAMKNLQNKGNKKQTEQNALVPQSTNTKITPVEEEVEEQQPFQVGELVRYMDGDKAGSIYQIIDIQKSKDGFSYDLLGTNEQSISAVPSKMISVELDELLQLTSRSVIVQVVIVIERDDHLLMDSNNMFPSFIHDSDKDVHDAIKHFVSGTFKSKTTSIEPLSHIAKGNTVTLAYHIRTALNNMGRYSLKPIQDHINSPLVRPLVMSKEVDQLSKELKEIERFLPKKPPVFSSVNKEDLKHIPYQKDSIVASGITDNSSNEARKYLLRLERMVRTNIFGDVQVVVEYDPSGPREVHVESPRLSSELKHILNTVLNLVDYVLKSGTTPSELAKILDDQPKTMRLPLNDLLQIISVALQDAPDNVSSIRPEVLKSFSKTNTSNSRPNLAGSKQTGKRKQVSLK